MSEDAAEPGLLFTILDRVGEAATDGSTRVRPGRVVLTEQPAFMALARHVGLVPAAVYFVLVGMAQPAPDGTLVTVIARDELSALLTEKEGGGSHGGFKKDALRLHLSVLEAGGYITQISPNRQNGYLNNRFIMRRHLVGFDGGASSETAVVGTPQAGEPSGGGNPAPYREQGFEPAVGSSEIPPPGRRASGNPAPDARDVPAGEPAGGIPAAEDPATLMVDGEGETSSPITSQHDAALWAPIEAQVLRLGWVGTTSWLHQFPPEMVGAWVSAIRDRADVTTKGAYLREVLKAGSPPPPPNAPVGLPTSASPRVVGVDDTKLGAAPWDGGTTLNGAQIRNIIDDLEGEADREGINDLIRTRHRHAVDAAPFPMSREESRQEYNRIATRVLVDLGLAGPRPGRGAPSSLGIVDAATPSTFDAAVPAPGAGQDDGWYESAWPEPAAEMFPPEDLRWA